MDDKTIVKMKTSLLQLLLIPVATLLTLAAATAQTVARTEKPAADVIRGRIIDPQNAPVAGVAVVLFDRDSAYIDAVASDAGGRFEIRSAVRPFRLQLQHIAYEVRTVESDRSELGDIRLEEAATQVAAVVVEGERPVVKVEQGRLGYDLGRLTQGQAVNNAYEALTRLPGVMEQDGTLTLAGASSVTVILNGRPSTMTPEQLASLLRSTPVDRIEKAEVMFSAPPQYHVRGAAINVVMRRSHETAFSGELHANYSNRFYDSYDAGGNFLFSSPKWSADVTYSAARSKELTSFDLHSLHAFGGRQYDIRQDEWMTSEGWSHRLRTAVEYAPKQRGRVSAAYTASFSPNTDGLSRSTGSYVRSLSHKRSDRSLHNLALRYTSPRGLDLGLDYTHYDAPERSRLENIYADGQTTAFDIASGQRIDRINLTADERHTFASGWELTAGGAAAFARSHDRQHYTLLEGSPATTDTDSRLDEYTANLYAGFGRQFGKVGFTASLAGEYYRMGDYENWSLYPQASLNWIPSERHIVQLNLSSDKQYPAYWEMQGAVSYIDGYSEIHGTPGLRPSRSYEAQALYIYRQKYIFVLFWNERPDYFVQAAWQASDRLAMIYQTLNWNFNRQWGANAVVPFRIGKWLDSRLTLTGMRMRQKCDPFHDMSFDRAKWVGIARLVNTFHLCRRPAIDLEVNGFFQSGAIQGTFDINPVGSADAAVKWTFDRGRATLSVRCNDLFDSGMPSTKVRYRGQWLDMGAQRYTRTATVHFSYRFGGYKAKKHKEVDTSRFGH